MRGILGFPVTVTISENFKENSKTDPEEYAPFADAVVLSIRGESD
jgi:hypothetical protein